jgi:hypothetical protein
MQGATGNGRPDDRRSDPERGPGGAFFSWMEALFREIGLRDATVFVNFCQGQVVGVAHRNAAHYPLAKQRSQDGEACGRPVPSPAAADPPQAIPPEEINAAIRRHVALWLKDVEPNWTSFARLKLHVADHAICSASCRLRFIPEEGRLFDALLTWSPESQPDGAPRGLSRPSHGSSRRHGRKRGGGKLNRRRSR